MREWHKPTIEETGSGMEVTSYLPAEPDSRLIRRSHKISKRRIRREPGRRFAFCPARWRIPGGSITL